MKELLEEVKKVYPANWIYDEDEDLICHDEGSALYSNDYCISTLSNGYLIYCSGFSYTFPEKKDLIMALQKFYSHDHKNKKQPNNIIELLEEVKKVYPSEWRYDEEEKLIYNRFGNQLDSVDYHILELQSGYLLYCTGFRFTFPEKKDLLMTLKKFYSHDTKKQPNSIIELLEEIKQVYPAKWIYEDDTQILYNGDGCAKKGNDYCMTISYRVTQEKSFYYYCIRGTNYVEIFDTKEEFINELKKLYKKHK